MKRVNKLLEAATNFAPVKGNTYDGICFSKVADEPGSLTKKGLHRDDFL